MSVNNKMIYYLPFLVRLHIKDSDIDFDEFYLVLMRIGLFRLYSFKLANQSDYTQYTSVYPYTTKSP